MRFHSSLESRICILAAGLLFALLLAVGHVQMSGHKSALAEEKAGKYEALSRILALSYAEAQRSSPAFYADFTRRIMEADKDISHVIISDSDGRVIFGDARGRSRLKRDSAGMLNVKRVLSLVRRLGRPGNSGLDTVRIPTMLGPTQKGTVAVGFSPDSINRAIEESQNRLLATFAVAFLIGLLGAISMARAIARPLRELIHGAQAVGKGDLEVVVPVYSCDELGSLADAFNKMVVALRESRNRLVERANTDGLTDLYNHRHFQERLATEISRSQRFDRPLSVIMLDIDQFKVLNDTHGHPIGDVVLQEIAQILITELRDIDVVARYGGEEFALILPETILSEAVAVAERVRLTVQRHCFAGKDDQTIPVTVSLGVAQYPIHSTEREGLVMAADLAMYQAKSMGRNQTAAFSNDIRDGRGSDPYQLCLLLHAADMSTIEAMAAAVDAKGQRRPGFSKAVMAHSVATAQELGLPEKEQNDVRIASLLHDIGKLGISHAVLNKQGQYTDAERRTIMSHPAMGYAIVQKSRRLQSMLPGILHHHERWDGEGYPTGLRGEEIPLIARIILVADAYHAMTAERPHKPEIAPEEARAELRNHAGTQFDPRVVDAFLRVLEREGAKERAA